MMQKDIRIHRSVGYVMKKKNNDKDKERDHCHITGKFRGAAHKKRNVI